MKSTFSLESKKISPLAWRLYEEQAVVIKVSFHPKMYTTANGEFHEYDDKVNLDVLKKSFLDAFTQNNINYELVENDGKCLAIAISRKDEEKARMLREELTVNIKVLRNLFNRQASVYFYKQDSAVTNLENMLIGPFSKTRQEVYRNVQRLNNG